LHSNLIGNRARFFEISTKFRKNKRLKKAEGYRLIPLQRRGHGGIVLSRGIGIPVEIVSFYGSVSASF
jgi:uridine phosphorylase